jgi:iron complex transport system substrate-binding protein
MRIVSLLPAATEILFELGAGDHLVAVSHECNYPLGALTKPQVTKSRISVAAPSGLIDEHVKSAMTAGEPLYDLDQDLIGRLRPDLVVTQAQCDVCAVRYADVVDLCRRSNALQHTEILPLNPMSVAEVLADIERIGNAAGVPEQGQNLVARLSDRIKKVRHSVGESRNQTRVVIIEWLDPIMIAGNWTPELVEVAGGSNGLSVGGRHSTYHAWDEVVRFDPEVIVVAPCGFNLTRTIKEMHFLGQRPQWRSISAVRAGRVFAVDGDGYFNRPGPRLVDSLELLASLLHADLFPPPDDSICKRWSA